MAFFYYRIKGQILLIKKNLMEKFAKFCLQFDEIFHRRHLAAILGFVETKVDLSL